MRIGLIGSGRVATHLALALYGQGHQVVSIYSRKRVQAEQLAMVVSGSAVEDIASIDFSVDVLLIAVTDQAISTIVASVAKYKPNCLVVHTSGSTNISVLSEHIKHTGVFYPLQTFSMGCDIHWPDVPLLIEASDKKRLLTLRVLAQSLSNHVYEYCSEQRLSLHLAAVFASNFSNYCYDVAQQILDKQAVDFQLLYPLMQATVQKAMKSAPVSVQTGPAARHDDVIIKQHQKLLEQLMPNEAQLYTVLSEQIQKRHQLG